MPANNNNQFYSKTFKNKSWANYQYEIDQARSPEEKRAARKEYENILAEGERQKAENDKKRGNEPEVRKWNLEKKSKAREDKQQKEAEEKRKLKEAEKAARKEKRAAEEEEKAEAMKKGDVKKLQELNLKKKETLLKKIGHQTKKCKWENEPGGCWAHTQRKCPFKHKCNNAKGGTRKLRR